MPTGEGANQTATRPDFKPVAAAAAVRRPPGQDAAIAVKDLSVFFGRRQVLDRVSLEIPASAVTAIIGPSGCGKSTFLRALNRMHELFPDARMEGEIRLFGKDIYSRDVEPVHRAPPGRDGVSEVESVSDHVHRRERHRGPAVERGARPRSCWPSARRSPCAWRRCGTR